MAIHEPKRTKNFPALQFPDQDIFSYYSVFIFNFQAYEDFMKVLQWYYDRLANKWVHKTGWSLYPAAIVKPFIANKLLAMKKFQPVWEFWWQTYVPVVSLARRLLVKLLKEQIQMAYQRKAEILEKLAINYAWQVMSLGWKKYNERFWYRQPLGDKRRYNHIQTFIRIQRWIRLKMNQIRLRKCLSKLLSKRKLIIRQGKTINSVYYVVSIYEKKKKDARIELFNTETFELLDGSFKHKYIKKYKRKPTKLITMVTLNKKDKIKMKKDLIKKLKYDYNGVLFVESKTLQKHDFTVVAYR